jgi:hypothetical protein
MLALALALATGGCSFSYQLDSLFSKKDDSPVERTGSLRSSAPKGVPEPPAEADLADGRAAPSLR